MCPVSPGIRESLPRGVGVGSGVEVGVVVGVEWWLDGTFGGGPVICSHQLSHSESLRGYNEHSRAVCDAAWSREMDPDVPSKRDIGRSEVEACRTALFGFGKTIQGINRLSCLMLLDGLDWGCS